MNTELSKDPNNVTTQKNSDFEGELILKVWFRVSVRKVLTVTQTRSNFKDQHICPREKEQLTIGLYQQDISAEGWHRCDVMPMMLMWVKKVMIIYYTILFTIVIWKQCKIYRKKNNKV